MNSSKLREELAGVPTIEEALAVIKPILIAKRRDFHRKYYLEYKERPGVKERLREYCREYRSRPEVKARKREQKKRSEVKG